MSAHESFASLEEASVEVGKYLPFRKEVRPGNAEDFAASFRR